MMTGIEGLASCFQPDPLAGADNQYTHNEPVITELRVSPDYKLGGDAGERGDAHDHYRRCRRRPARWTGRPGMRASKKSRDHPDLN